MILNIKIEISGEYLHCKFLLYAATYPFNYKVTYRTLWIKTYFSIKAFRIAVLSKVM